MKIFDQLEKIIIIILLVMMMLVILASVVELGILLIADMINPPAFLLNIGEMLEIFGLFLMVLIGLELLESIKAYLHDDKLHVEIVFLVAMVAVARKVIILDYKKTSPEILLGMSAIIISLAAGFFLVKRSMSAKRNQDKSDSGPDL
jgi:uncharacterized membrane protein (DUF373 family)